MNTGDIFFTCKNIINHNVGQYMAIAVLQWYCILTWLVYSDHSISCHVILYCIVLWGILLILPLINGRTSCYEYQRHRVEYGAVVIHSQEMLSVAQHTDWKQGDISGLWLWFLYRCVQSHVLWLVVVTFVFLSRAGCFFSPVSPNVTYHIVVKTQICSWFECFWLVENEVVEFPLYEYRAGCKAYMHICFISCQHTAPTVFYLVSLVVCSTPSPLKQWSASPTTCGFAETPCSAVAAAAWGAAAAGAAGPCVASRSAPPSPPTLWGCSGRRASRCPWPPSATPPPSRGARPPRSAGGWRESGSWFEYMFKIELTLREENIFAPFPAPEWYNVKMHRLALSHLSSGWRSVSALHTRHAALWSQQLSWLLTHASNQKSNTAPFGEKLLKIFQLRT